MAEDQERPEERDSAARPVTAAARRERRASAGGSTPASRVTERGPAKPRRAGQSSGARTRKAVLDKPDTEEAEETSATKGTPKKSKATPTRDRRDRQPSVFARLIRFLREVVGELRKVIWPTRKQQITYTVVVLVFVAVIVALVSGLDLLFAKGVFWIFA